MIGKYVYDQGKVLGVIHGVEFRQAHTAYDHERRLVWEEARWLLLIEEHGTGKLIERYAEGLTIRLVPESEKEPS